MIEILENEKISKHYESLGLGIPTYIGRFDTISGNDKYLVIVDGKKTILSIYHNRSFDKVNRVYNFLEGLRGTEVRTAFPLAKPSELDGHPTLVIEYVEGVETAPHINSYIQVTEVLARIHEFSRMFLPNASVRHDPRVFLKSLPNKIEDSSLISSEEFDEIINLLYRLSNLRKSLDDYMAKGLIHADPIIGNTITSNEGELFLIDFDNLRQDVLALDLGYLIENCLLINSESDEKDIGILIDSYKQFHNTEGLEVYIAFAMIDKIIYSLFLLFNNPTQENTQKLEKRMNLYRKFKNYIFKVMELNEES